MKFLSGRVAPWQFREGRQTFSFEPAGRLMLSDPEIVLDAVLAGLGIAQMAQHHAWDALTDGRLQRVLVQGERGYVIMSSAGPEAVLTVLAKPNAKLGLIFLDIKRAAETLSKLI